MHFKRHFKAWKIKDWRQIQVHSPRQNKQTHSGRIGRSFARVVGRPNDLDYDKHLSVRRQDQQVHNLNWPPWQVIFLEVFVAATAQHQQAQHGQSNRRVSTSETTHGQDLCAKPPQQLYGLEGQPQVFAMRGELILLCQEPVGQG